ncbi:MAG: long-chain-fatty-acid--CoA ligase [Flavobacteriaceae bacterium]
MWNYPVIRTLGDIARFHAKQTPEKPAILCEGKATSFKTLDLDSNRIANALLRADLPAEMPAGFIGKNSPFFTTLLFGAAKAGRTLLALNWRLSAREIGEIIGYAECRFLIADQSMIELAREACRHAGMDVEIVLAPVDVASPDWDRFMDGCDDLDPQIAVPEDMTALLLFTSGTTGLPKGVELTHANFNFIRLTEHLDDGLPWEADDVYLMSMPNFHTAGTGLMLQSLYVGSTVVMLEAFEPKAVLKAITDTRPTIILIVPSALQMLLDHPDAATVDFTCFKLVMYAGSPISLPLIKRAMAEMKSQFVQWYGATETVGAMTLLRADQHDLEREESLKSCGTTVPLVDIEIVDEHGKEVPVGTVGEVMIRTPSLFKGYWRNPEATRAAQINGWYKTGDAAYRDAAGFIYIVDRIKDMIISGGENVYSAEVERALLQHPDVSEAAAIGMPDAKWGEAVTGIIVLKEGKKVSESDIISFCRDYLGGYKVPKSIIFTDALPRTPSGKVQKNLLRDKFRAEAAS